MIVTEKDGEIRNWINKNKDKHKWVTHTMLDLYAKHYHQEQVKKLNIDDVSKCDNPHCLDGVFRRSFFDEFNYPLSEVQRKWLRRTVTVFFSLLIMPIGAIIGLCEMTSDWYKRCW